jgi:LacI family transcriptional regulator
MSPEVEAQSLEANLPGSLPVVLLNCRVEGSPFDSINIDNYGGALMMGRHLVAQGHRRIAFVKGAPGNYDALERLLGYRDAVEPLSEDLEDLEIEGDFSQESGYRAGGEVLRLRPRPSAVFAANDAMAIGVLCALQEAGVCIPEEIAVAGFDDIPVARFISPPLTSVQVGIAELGGRAMERLLALMAAGDARDKQHEVLPTTLVVRGSCGAKKDGSEGPEVNSAMDKLHRRRRVR